MKRILFICIFFVTITTSCTKTKIVNIDNPTIKPIIFKIDEKNIKVYPLSLINFEIKSGTHTLEFNGKTQTFNIPKEGKFLINPTQSSYILEEVTYGRRNWNYSLEIEKINKARSHFNKNTIEKEERKLFLIDTLNIENFTLVGFFRKTNDIVIRNVWDYDVNQKVPNEILMKINKNFIDDESIIDNPIMGNVNIIRNRGKVKLYRYNDFIKELKNNQ